MYEKFVIDAGAALTESATTEFKESFSPSELSDWCELIKDIIAISNSGGGCIVFGLTNDGQFSSWSPDVVRRLDPARVTDKISAYTNIQFIEFSLCEVMRADGGRPALAIGSRRVPVVFTRPGTYPTGPGKQKSAFAQGTVYFRHGAKSETANQEDFTAAVDRAVETLRSSWLGNIQKVVEAPAGYRIELLPPEVHAVDSVPIRIVDDSNAPAYRLISPDESHPYRQKELLAELNRRFSGRVANQFDLQSVRRAFGIDSLQRFCHSPKYGSRQYSKLFAEWLEEQIRADPKFLTSARSAAQTGSPAPITPPRSDAQLQTSVQ